VTRDDQSGLVELAASHGIQTSYTDVDGVDQQADPGVVVALLRSLGVPLEQAQDAPALVRDQKAGALRRRLEPVLVHRIGRGGLLTALVPHDAEPDSIWLSLELEDGTTSRRALTAVMAPSTNRAGGAVGTSIRVQFDLDRLAEEPVPAGYHHLTLEGAGVPESALVVVAPDCPEGRRQWGAFLPLHALRTEHDSGVGTYSDLGRLSDWVSSLGGGLVGTLPLYPAFLDPPADPSPYLPVSRLAYNELFIDPTVLPEYAASPAARTPWSPDCGPAGIGPAPVDYEGLARQRRRELEPLAAAVCSGAYPDRRRGLEDFAAAHPELVAYARFRAGREATSRREPDQTAVTYHLYTQWVACEQLAGLAHHGGRYADFPVGSHPEGFDPVWSPQSFVPGVQGGSPPDRFFAGGQRWGFRPLHPERIREDGYRYFTAALQRAFLHADCLRIDHVMGLQRMYMVPDGHDATEGAYVSYRAEELHALVALEASRAGAVVVGEDLGTVPEGVRERMAKDRMLRTWVFQFESTPADPLPRPASNTLASTGTHDLPRFGAFLWGEDIDEREGVGLLSPDDAAAAHAIRRRWRLRLLGALGLDPESEQEQLTAAALRGCLRHLARSEARVVLVDLEEMWDERVAQNHPGTESNDNWRRRARRTFEDFSSDPALEQSLSELTALRAS
jgi:4-alpha-glucanotransferase